MLLTKYKVQELVENAKIDLDKLEKYAGVKKPHHRRAGEVINDPRCKQSYWRVSQARC